MALTSLSQVLRALALIRTSETTFRTPVVDPRADRVFGGLVLAQALLCAGRTTSDGGGSVPASLHARFLARVRGEHPLELRVDRLREGPEPIRLVSARQGGRPVFELAARFAARDDPVPEPTTGHQPLAGVPGPEVLVDVRHRLAAFGEESGGWWVRERPFDLRYVDPHPREVEATGEEVTRTRTWLRPRSPLPPGHLLHACLLAFASDMTLLDPAMSARRLTNRSPGLVASLDHAMWFGGPVELGGWMLYDRRVAQQGASRSLVHGELVRRDGQVLATVIQEGYFAAPVEVAGHAPAAPRAQVESPSAGRDART